MNNLKNWITKMMAGRYGVDQLSLVLLVLSIVLSIPGTLFDLVFLRVISLLAIILCYFRILSKNTYKRQQENFKFIRFYTPLMNKAKQKYYRLTQLKKYKYFKCPHCHQTLRVPRKKGKLTVTCPKCKHSFHKRS